MLIRRLEVESWRGLAQPVALAFPEGLTLVAGPNESGKTSLREALRAAFLESPKGKRKAIMAPRPWETTLCPRVAVEFVLDGAEWKVAKEFLKGKGGAELYKDGRLVARDDQVQDHLEAALGVHAQWIDVLWGSQGDVRFEAEVPDSLKSRLAASAQDAVSPGIGWLEERIYRDYDKHFTEKTGRPKKTLQDVRQQTMDAETTLRQAEALLEAANARNEAIGMLMAQRDGARAQEAAVRQRLEIARAQVGAWDRYQRAVAEAEAARQRWKSAQDWLQRWTRLGDDVVALWPSLQSYAERLASLKARAGEPPSRTAVENLAAEQAYLDLCRRQDLATQLQSLHLPSAESWRRMRDLDQEGRQIEAALDMGSLDATLQALTALSPILQRDGDEPETFTMTAGTRAPFTADQEFRLELPGVAVIEVKSGNRQVQDQLGRRAALEQELESLLESVKAATVQEVEDRQQQAQLLKVQLGGTGPTPEALATARARVENADSLDGILAPARQQRLEALPGLIQAEETEWKQRQSAHQGAQQEWHQLLAENPESRLGHLLQEMRRALEVAPDAGVSLAVPDQPTSDWIDTVRRGDWKQPWEASSQRLQAEHQDLLGAAARPTGEEVTHAQIDALDREAEKLRQQYESLSGDLQQKMGEVRVQGDVYSRKVQAAEAYETAQSRQQREELEAHAIKLLYAAFNEAKAELQRNVVAPLQSRVGQRFAALTQGRYRAVSFDPSFHFDGVVPAVVSKAPVDDLSFGTREQMAFLVRLCLAELLSEQGESQIVVFDDNLVHTDRHRMAQATAMLLEAAQRLQIIVFTCHPERYPLAEGSARVLSIDGIG